MKRSLLPARAVETVRCLEERAAETPLDAEHGTLCGQGFPTWRKRAACFIDAVGLTSFVVRADKCPQRYRPGFMSSPRSRGQAARGDSFFMAGDKGT